MTATPADLTPDLLGPMPVTEKEQALQAARRYADELPHARGGRKALVYRQMIDCLKAATAPRRGKS